MLKLDWLETLGDRNPQLLRELTGRLKPRSLILAGAISLLGQLLLFMSFLARLPHATQTESNTKEIVPAHNPYCTVLEDYGSYRKCLVDAAGNIIIDWQRWSLDLFIVLSIISIFGLLVAGTYLLIDNLAYEERKGTLNFIRQSPRSPQNILWGKIFGVPILLYIVALLAIPLHLGAGIAAHISLIHILSFYFVLAIGGIFFYSLALLFGLISFGGLNGFQAWLGSGIAFMLLFCGLYKPVLGNTLDWINVFSPALVLQYLIASTGIEPAISYSYLKIPNLSWFGLPVGNGMLGVSSILIINYSLWTYWSWQAMKRRFPNPCKNIFSKGQSYLIVVCFELMALGFAGSGDRYHQNQNVIWLLSYNFLLFSGLIITLTPQRQALIDWARYRKQKFSRKALLNLSLLRDLVWGEKSPAIVAIAINAIITTTILTPWIFVSSYEFGNLSVLVALGLSLSLMMVCAVIAQLVVLMQTQKPGLWIIGALGAVIILPPLTLGLLSVDPYKAPTLWLFTVFAFGAIKEAEVFNIFLALLGQLSILTIGAVQIKRQLKKAGASNSVGLFAASKAQLPH